MKNPNIIFILVAILIILVIFLIYYINHLYGVASTTKSTPSTTTGTTPGTTTGTTPGTTTGTTPGTTTGTTQKLTYINNYMNNTNVSGQTSNNTYGVYDIIISRYAVFGGNPKLPFNQMVADDNYPPQAPTYILQETNAVQPYDSHILTPVGPNTGIYNIYYYRIDQTNNTTLTILSPNCTTLTPTTCSFIPSYGTFNNNTMASPLNMWNNSKILYELYNPYVDPTGATNYLSQTLVINKFILNIINATVIMPMMITIAIIPVSYESIVVGFYIVPPIANFILNVHIGN